MFSHECKQENKDESNKRKIINGKVFDYSEDIKRRVFGKTD
jgi:hypothetical protein